ncbi:MAG TPA: hypothetical protein VFE62_09900 [Gemmataceae bacterium]|nr:hypothetical protein [Gemmataceae bacterium]
MTAPTFSSRWIVVVLSPLFLMLLFALATDSAEGAPTKARRVAPKAPTVQNAANRKSPTFSGAKNKAKKFNNAGKNKKSVARRHHRKHHHHRRNRASRNGQGSSNLIAQIRRDEARLNADLNRLKKLLR